MVDTIEILAPQGKDKMHSFLMSLSAQTFPTLGTTIAVDIFLEKDNHLFRLTRSANDEFEHLEHVLFLYILLIIIIGNFSTTVKIFKCIRYIILVF